MRPAHAILVEVVNAPGIAAPVLKWAGGKRQLLPHLRTFYPDHLSGYVEPFLGSGAVFFDLWGAGRLRGARVVLADGNADLIGTYLRLADSSEAVERRLLALAEGHRRLGREHYYQVRDRQFNPERARWRSGGGRADDYPAALAAMLLYLNRTGYNGLFRLNKQGDFNVPAGRYDSPTIVRPERVRDAAAALSMPNVCLRCCPFDAMLAEVGRGDFVYLDPPYAPLSTTSNFRSYTAGGFDESDQERLRNAVVAASTRGASILLSNSTAPSILRLYDDEIARRAGLRCLRVRARRAINSRGDGRGTIEELLVTNLPRRV